MIQSQIIVILFILQIGYADIQSLGYPQFAHYVNTYTKSYSRQEYIIRETYYNNTAKKASELGLRIKQYSIGINQYWDNTPQQVSHMTNGVKLSWTISASLRKQTPSNSSLQYINWKDNGKVTPVKYQGRLINGGWIFSYIAYTQSYALIHHNETFDFSEQQILNCADPIHNGPQKINLAHQWAQKGLALQKQFRFEPLNPIRDVPGICDDYVKHNFFFDLGAKTNLSDEELIEYLTYGPLIVAVDPQNWLFYDHGIYQCQQTSYSEITHAVLLIGVTEEYWIIKNSWGLQWGQTGYIRITRKRANNCGIGLYSFVNSNMQHFYSLWLAILLLLLCLV